MPSPARKLVAIVWSGLLAFFILLAFQLIWGALLAANFKNKFTAPPWSVVVMAVVLWLLWQYLGGRWWPASTSQWRRRHLRANRVTGRAFATSFIAGIFAVVALAGYWIVFFQLSKTPPNALPDIFKFPLTSLILLLVMSSLVSPFAEEIAFRGYCQQILEREFAGPSAVVLSSLLFMLAHVNHGWYWPKLTVYLLAGLVFGAIALLTNSILTSIPVHFIGDFTFFALVWPHDATRRLVTQGGADSWFWIHVAQAVIFTLLALLVFQRLARLRASVVTIT